MAGVLGGESVGIDSEESITEGGDELVIVMPCSSVCCEAEEWSGRKTKSAVDVTYVVLVGSERAELVITTDDDYLHWY